MMGRREMLMRLNSLEEATVTGNPVTFNTDVAKPLLQTLIGMEPVQDLHGQDAPYPAGGGKQLIPENGTGWYSPYGQISSTFANGVWTITNNHSSNRSMQLDLGVLAAGTYYFSAVSSPIITGLYIKAKADGSTLVSITVGASATSFTLAEDTEAYVGQGGLPSGTTTLTGLMLSATNVPYAPYSNICPITGWTGYTVYHSGADTSNPDEFEVTFPAVGKNLFGGIALANAIKNAVPNAVLDTENKTITFSPVTKTLLENFFKADTRYTFIMTLANSYLGHNATNVGYKTTDGVSVNLQKDPNDTGKQTIVHQSINGRSLSTFFVTQQLGTTTIYYEESGIFEGLKTAADFEPYTNTVYGGTVDLATGTLTVDRAMDTINSESALTINGTIVGVLTEVKYVPSAGKANGYNNILSDRFAVSGLTEYGKVWGRPTSGNVFFLLPDTITTESEAKAWFGANPTQLVYELATPIIYHLTSQQITALIGDNTVWSDTNGVNTITYLKKK